MPLTNAQKQHRARKKKAAMVVRYEAALREITDLNITSDRNRPDEVVEDMVSIARQALNPTTAPHAGERDE